jgi:hypothetical protein
MPISQQITLFAAAHVVVMVWIAFQYRADMIGKLLQVVASLH